MDLTWIERQMIRTIAECDLNVSRAARVYHYHRNTLVYHCEKIKRKTGLDPRVFWDMIKLLEAMDESNPV